MISKFVINLLPFAKYLPGWINGNNVFTTFRETFSKWANKVLETTKNNYSRCTPSLINLLTNSKDEDNNTSLTYEQIIDNTKVFYIAGHETTATLITVTFYYLLRNLKIIKKLQDEIDLVLGNSKEITIEHIDKLIYLQCVIKESLRIRNSVAGVSRDASEDVYIGKYFLPKGTRVIISINSMHHDPNYWEKPEEYFPERWINLNDTVVRADGYYIPFSAGPRICIGQRLAREEALVYFALVLKNFDVNPPLNFDKDKPIENSGITNIKDVNVLFSKRKFPIK